MSHRTRTRTLRRRQHHQGRPRGPEAMRLTFSCYVAKATGAEAPPVVVPTNPQETVAWADKAWARYEWPIYARRRHPLLPTVRLQGRMGSMQMPLSRSSRGGVPPVAVCLLPDEHERPDYIYGMQAETRRSNHQLITGKRLP